jgi:hypothetical protein
MKVTCCFSRGGFFTLVALSALICALSLRADGNAKGSDNGKQPGVTVTAVTPADSSSRGPGDVMLTSTDRTASKQSPVKGNNGVGNGEDPQPPGNPRINDGPGTSPGNPGNRPPRP